MAGTGGDVCAATSYRGRSSHDQAMGATVPESKERGAGMRDPKRMLLRRQEQMLRDAAAEPSPEPEAAPVFDGGCLQHKGSPCDCREILDRMPDFLNDSSELVSVTPPASEAQAPAVPRYRINCEGELEESSRFGILVTVEDHLAEVASLREKLAQAEHKGWSDAIEAVVTMLTSVFGWHKNSRGIDAIRSLAKREKE